MLSLPVLEGLLAGVVSIHALFARGPLAGADLTMFLNMLECLNEAEDFIDITAYWEIIVLHVS